MAMTDADVNKLSDAKVNNMRKRNSKAEESLASKRQRYEKTEAHLDKQLQRCLHGTDELLTLEDRKALNEHYSKELKKITKHLGHAKARNSEAEEMLEDKTEVSRKRERFLHDIVLLSLDEPERNILCDYYCEEAQIIREKKDELVQQEIAEYTASEVRQTQDDNLSLIQGGTHGRLASGLSDEEDVSADPNVTVQAGPAPSAGNTAGQAQLAALGPAGLVAKTAKEKSKKKNSVSGAKHRKRKRKGSKKSVDRIDGKKWRISSTCEASASEAEGGDISVKKKKLSKSKARQHEAEADNIASEAVLGELRAPDVATELANGPEAEAAGEQPEDSDPAETDGPPADQGTGQPADPTADQEATEAIGTPLESGAAPTAGVSSAAHSTADEASTSFAEEVPHTTTAAQAAAAAVGDIPVDLAGSPQPAQRKKVKRHQSGGDDKRGTQKERKGSKMQGSNMRLSPDTAVAGDICSDSQLLAGSADHSAALQHGFHLQGHEPDRYVTPPKRTKIQPHAARKGGWVTVEQMEITNGDNKHEVYKPGESVFVLGNAEQPYVCGEPLCVLCDRPSAAEDRGSDLLECDRCMGAVHFHCAALTEAPEDEYLCPSCKNGTRDLGQDLFKARPGLEQTPREQLLSGNNMVFLAQIVALRQHVNFAQELSVVFEADVKWYEVPRDNSNKLDCRQFKINEVLLREGETETVSCGAFIRKAFVTNREAYTAEEVHAKSVDLDDVLYCFKPNKPADKADAEEDSVMQSSSKAESVADSDDDKDYEPEALSKQESRSCSASEAEEDEPSTSRDNALADREDGQYEQSKGIEDARAIPKTGNQSASKAQRKRKHEVPLWVTAKDDVHTYIEPELLTEALKEIVSREEQLRKPLSRAVADLNPDRPWDALHDDSRQQEAAYLHKWIADKVKFVLGPAGCGKTLTVNNVLSRLQSLPVQDRNDAGWPCVRVDVQYTRTLPQFYKLLSQAILGDIKLSLRHEETLDNLFLGGQSKGVKKLVLVLDNFDQLAAHCKPALTKLGRWRKHFTLKIIAVSCLAVPVPKELGGLGPKNRELCLQPYNDDMLKKIIRGRLTDAQVVPEATISRAVFKMKCCGKSNVRDVLDTLCKAAQAALMQQSQACSDDASSPQALECVTPLHVESVLKEQVKSSMLDSLLQLSRRDTRLLMLVHKGRTTRSHANVESVGYLADAIQQSKQWEEVPFHEVQKSVQQLVHAGMLQEVNKEHGPCLQVRLGAACQEVEELMRLRVFEGPMF